MKKIPKPSLEDLQTHFSIDMEFESGDFIIESKILPHVFIGVGETIPKAIRSFQSAAEAVYEEALTNNIAGYDFIVND